MKRKKPKLIEESFLHEPKLKNKKTFSHRIIVRKDGKPNCFVCYRPLNGLRRLRKMKAEGRDYGDEYVALRIKVNNSITMLTVEGRKFPLYRHNKCEPGSAKHSKNKILNKHFEKTQGE